MNTKLRIDLIRAKLSSGGKIVGGWQTLPCPEVSEMLGGFGFDFVCVDLEHGNITRHQLPNIFRALELGNTLPMARIAKPIPYLGVEAMEMGACGIVVPQVSSKKQLADIKNAISYNGSRGHGFSRANKYGQRFHEHREEMKEPLIIPMFETSEAIDNIDDILSVGVDAALIGPFDLSASLGCTGEWDNPLFIQSLDKFKEACKRNNVATGYHVIGSHLSMDPVEEFYQREKEGYTFFVYSGDISFIHRARVSFSEIREKI